MLTYGHYKLWHDATLSHYLPQGDVKLKRTLGRWPCLGLWFWHH